MHTGAELPGDIWSWVKAARKPEPGLPPDVIVRRNTPEDNLGVIGSYQWIYENADDADVIAYLHDDVECKEKNWDQRVMREFEDPSVGVVGFGGAPRHGHPDLYKVPYKLQNLARYNYRSNVTDAEVHGERFTGSCDVAVIDGFAIVARRVLLDCCGGWPVDRYPPHHNYDYWICAMAHRHGYRVRMCGIRCHHRGGGTAIGTAYHEWCKTTKWGSDVAMHEAGHRLIYEDFRDVLPFSV